ncbi:MAG: ribosomal subunit interface protein [Candidatus Lindowbacteria bacterium RIFCSPLOWO2_12_FULL_62_27]|nr:MAG: ribosomal subunit interface protein [Candidatus Lindowbacteria bacterium RIFCSPLOWO2_02_FULL_62_12]OGH61396.1 MAG: ribosomal subunit interface protein [Candidatus Lindowbacteria bacterium RIFCSPLOWO2_12_FULL_62_27]
MQLKVTGRDFPLTRSLKDYVERRLERVERHVPRIIRVDAILRMERNDHIADIRLSAAKFKLAVSGRSTESMYASIDDAIGKLERVSMRQKERKIQTPRQRAIRDHRARAARQDREAGADDGDVVKVTKLWVKPMSVDEAMLQLKTLDYSFFVFQDAEDSHVKVIYRRNDLTMGLIEPDVA